MGHEFDNSIAPLAAAPKEVALPYLWKKAERAKSRPAVGSCSRLGFYITDSEGREEVPNRSPRVRRGQRDSSGESGPKSDSKSGGESKARG